MRRFCRKGGFTLAFVVQFWLFSSISLAQSYAISQDSFDLPSAVVVGDRSPVSLQSVGHSYDVITRKELESLPIGSTAEALQFVAGLDLRQRGVNGVQADLSIRGGTFDQALVLVNGIRLADPQTGHHLLNIPVPFENIERIEVIKGPGARLYGQNAFAGAINIITKVEDTRSTSIRGEVGQHGLGGFGVSLSLPMQKINQTLSYQRDFAQGYRANTDYTIQNVFYQAEIGVKQGTLNFMAGLSDRAFGANGFYASATATQQYEEIQTSILALTYKQQTESSTFSQRLSWRRNQDEYIFIRSNPSIYRNLHISQVVSYDAYKSIKNSLGRLGIGADVQAVGIRSNNLGDHQRGVFDGIIEQEFSLLDMRLRITPGLSFNYLSDAGSRVLPGLDINYLVQDNLSIYGNAGMTYRIPTYTDLYYSDRFNEGNENLVAERAIAVELGTRYEKNGVEAKASLWRRDAIDLIDFVRTSIADTVWQPQNFTDASFQGVEVSLAARRKATWLPLASISYNFIDASLPASEGTVISRYALDQLKHQLIGLAVFQLTPSLSSTLTYRLADREVEVASDAIPVDYQLFDLRLAYNMKQFNFFAEATNLFDVQYAQANGVVLPGRWSRAGMTLKLN